MGTQAGVSIIMSYIQQIARSVAFPCPLICAGVKWVGKLVRMPGTLTALNCVGLFVHVCECACLFVLGQEGYLVNFSAHESYTATAPSVLPHRAPQTSSTQICQCTSALTSNTPSIPVMSLQHLLRRNCQLFWFLLNCVMLSSVGNCPLVTSLGPLNSNPNLAFWRWRDGLIYPGTILRAPSPLYYTHSSKVSRKNLHLNPIPNQG